MCVDICSDAEAPAGISGQEHVLRRAVDGETGAWVYSLAKPRPYSSRGKTGGHHAQMWSVSSHYLKLRHILLNIYIFLN